MKDVLSALIGAIVTGVLSVWLIPILRDGRRISPSQPVPTYYRPSSPNLLILRSIQWLFWGELSFNKNLIEVLQARLARPRTTNSEMFIHTSGSVYYFNPIPVFTSLIKKTPYIMGATFVIGLMWHILVLPLMSIFISVGPDAAATAFGIMFLLLFIESIIAAFVGMTNRDLLFATLVIVFRDSDAFMPPEFQKPLKARPMWRISPDLKDHFEWRRIFSTLSLIEISVDNGTTWTFACSPGYMSYRISRLVERNLDWQSQFAVFLESVNRELDSSPVLGAKLPASVPPVSEGPPLMSGLA
jgi:hypothetical protein